MVGGVAVVGERRLAEQIGFLQNAVGAIAGPFDSFLALRGLKTLALRMRQSSEIALAIAGWLEKHPRVERVLYPGLPSHPQHALAQRQMRHGYSGIVTFFVKGGLDGSAPLPRALSSSSRSPRVSAASRAWSITPAIMTHASVPAETRAKLGIDDSLIRLSVGIEDVEDLLADLESALG